MPQTPAQFEGTPARKGGMTPEQFGGPATPERSLASRVESEIGTVSAKANELAKEFDPSYTGDKEVIQNAIAGVKQEWHQAVQDFHGAQRDPNILHAAEDLYVKAPWHLLNMLGAPVGALLQQGVVDPLDAAIGVVAKKVSHAFPKGAANQPGWGIHRGDVIEQARHLQSMVGPTVMAASMFIGGHEVAPEVFKPGEEPSTLPETPEEIGGSKPKRVPVPGKPHIRLKAKAITTEEAAHGVSQAAQEVTRSAVEHKATAKDLASDRMAGLSRTWRAFHELEGKVRGQLELYSKNRHDQPMGLKTPKTAGDLIDNLLLPNSGSQIAPLLRKLQPYVKDVPIHFTKMVISHTPEGLEADPGTLGYYRYYPEDPQHLGEIVVATGEHNKLVGRTVIHEMVHAATSRFIRMNPDSPEVAELRRLYQKVRRETEPDRAAAARHQVELPKTAGGGTRMFYGEHDLHEFVAEALSNPKFQSFLGRLKVAGKTAWHALSSIILGMLGMSGKESENLLHHVMQVSTHIMERQREWDISSHMKQQAAEPPFEPAPADLGQIQAMKVSDIKPAVKSSPPVKKLSDWIDELQRNIAPETLGEKAKKAGTIIASRTSEFMHQNMAWRHGSQDRWTFWEKNQHLVSDFVHKMERGIKLDNPQLEAIRQSYLRWNRQIAARDNEHLGLEYIPRDNYLMHVFKDTEAVKRWAEARWGKKWYNPGFIKDRTFDMYDEALKAGFKPRFTNPEDIMLARQMASDKAAMQLNILEDMKKYGLAIRKPKGLKMKPGIPVEEWRAPNGQMYVLHRDAWTVMSNAFGNSFWNMQGIGGDIFRGYMHLKNTVIPLKLMLNLFHPLHVAAIDNFNAATYAVADTLAGRMAPGKAVSELGKVGTVLYKPIFENNKLGSRLVKVWRGEIPADQMTDTDTQALQYMVEGGFVPRLSDAFRSKAVENFHKAVLQHSIKSVWRLPMALVHGLSYPIFEVWIPNLKAAAYIRGVQSALARDPALYDDALKRGMAFRRIAKSIDNRYGEMSYDTLFMNKYIKDLAVANTLSLGWQMGFIREYGGGMLDLGQWAKDGFKPSAVKSGNLDRAIYSVVSASMGLAFGGLITKALSGKNPQGIEDYIWPQSGETNPDGTPHRLSTPFYTREFGDIWKRMHNEGVIPGLSDTVRSKSAGIIGLLHEWATGVGQYGKEIRDPNAPAYKQVEQTLGQVLHDLEPISFGTLRKSYQQHFWKNLGLAGLGFNPAPKYATETFPEARIEEAYNRYEGKATIPYDQAQRSEAYRKLRYYYKTNDGRFYQQLQEIQDKYQLSDSDVFRITKQLQDNLGPYTRMFMRLPWQEQKRLLDAMTPEQREEYLPHANKEHLRYSYQPPEAQ